MANIKTHLNNIKGALYGKDVRNSIHDAIEQCYTDASINGNANMEVTQARGEYETLGERLDDHASQLAHKTNKTETQKLQTQVDGLVLGAVGDGNNAEIIQARGGYDLLYERLDNIDYNIDTFNNFNNMPVSNCYTKNAFLKWVKGAITYTNGNDSNSTFSIRSDFYSPIGDLSILNKNSDLYRVRVIRYTSGKMYDGYYGWFTMNGHVIRTNEHKQCFFRVEINRTDGENIDFYDALDNVKFFDTNDFTNILYKRESDLKYKTPWVISGCSTSDFTPHNYRISTINLQYADSDIIVTFDNTKYKVGVHIYESMDDFVNGIDSGWVTSGVYIIKKGLYYRIIVAQNTDTENVIDIYNSNIFNDISIKYKTEEKIEERKHNLKSNIISVAHQGGNIYGLPQNTKENFIEAIKDGWKAIEFDVIWSSDGVPFITHDDVKNIYGGGTLTITQTDSETIKNTRFWENESIKIPTFYEIIDICRLYGASLMIEFKTYSHTLEQQREIVEYTKHYNIFNKCIWTGFNISNLQRMINIDTNANVLLNLVNVPSIESLSVGGSNEDIYNLLNHEGSTVLAFSINLLNTINDDVENYLNKLRKLGFEICIYPVDSVKDMQTYVLYADYVTSNNTKVEDIL